MENVRFKWDHDGFRQLLLSEGVRDLVQSTAEEICDKANGNNTRGGEGFTVRTQVGDYGGGRYIAFVSSTDKNSFIAESEDKALTGALS